jgi:hypothetical protein
MNIKFRTYIGLAGDPWVLLIGESPKGTRMSTLYDRCAMTGLSYWWAKKKILWAFDMLHE